jgi:hypothetical protein
MKSKEFTNVPNEDDNLRRMLKTAPKPHAPIKGRKAAKRPKTKKGTGRGP